MKKTIGIIAVVLVLGGVYMFTRNKPAEPSPTTTGKEQTTTPAPTPQPEAPAPSPVPAASNPPAPAPAPAPTPTPPPAAQVKVFNVLASNFSLSPAEIRVKKGDQVKIVLTNEDGFHNFWLDEFNVRSKSIAAGEADIVLFTADKSGTFEYYCSVGNHRAIGMKGNFIVE